VGVGNTWTGEEKVEDFIVGTMFFGIVLTIGKNMVSGLEAHWFWLKQFLGNCTAHCSHCSYSFSANFAWDNGQDVFGVWGGDFFCAQFFSRFLHNLGKNLFLGLNQFAFVWSSLLAIVQNCAKFVQIVQNCANYAEFKLPKAIPSNALTGSLMMREHLTLKQRNIP
jgi:hypothetical protein